MIREFVSMSREELIAERAHWVGRLNSSDRKVRNLARAHIDHINPWIAYRSQAPQFKKTYNKRTPEQREVYNEWRRGQRAKERMERELQAYTAEVRTEGERSKLQRHSVHGNSHQDGQSVSGASHSEPHYSANADNGG
jgi:hypothetical protein